MGAVNMAASHMDRRSDHLIRPQLMHQKADSGNIGDRVCRPHLMKMNLVHRFSMGRRLRLGDQAVNLDHIGLYRLRQIQMGNHVGDSRHVGMMMVVMIMGMRLPMGVVIVHMRLPVSMVVMGVVMIFPMGVAAVGMLMLFPVRIHAFLLLAVNRYLYMGTRNAALNRFLRFHTHAGKSQTVHLFQKALPIRVKLQKRRRQHISSRPHTAVQINRSHSYSLRSISLNSFYFTQFSSCTSSSNALGRRPDHEDD